MAAPPAAVARLKAGADGGTAGVKAYDDAQTAVKASTRDATRALSGDAKGFAGNTNGLGPSLRAEVGAPGGVALANLAALRTAQQTANAAGAGGTGTYLDEAHAAVPVIDAEAHLDEAQREAMLAASTQRAATKAPKALTDAQLRTQLLGYAENQRAAAAAAAVHSEGKYVGNQETVLKNPAAGTSGANQSSAQRARLYGAPAASQEMQDPAQIQQAIRNAQAQALANIQQQQYGPGITAEAQRAGVAAGADPNRVAGLLGGNVEHDYLSNNEKLGLYHDPSLVQNVASDAISTATQLGYKPQQYRSAMKATYVDWNGATLSKAVASWLNGPDPEAAKLLAKGADASQAEIRDAFQAAHPSSHLDTNIVSDIIASAHSQITKGVDFGTFANTWLSDPNASKQPDAVQLGLEMVRQLFAYKQAQTRQGAISATGTAPGA